MAQCHHPSAAVAANNNKGTEIPQVKFLLCSFYIAPPLMTAAVQQWFYSVLLLGTSRNLEFAQQATLSAGARNSERCIKRVMVLFSLLVKRLDGMIVLNVRKFCIMCLV